MQYSYRRNSDERIRKLERQLAADSSMPKLVEYLSHATKALGFPYADAFLTEFLGEHENTWHMPKELWNILPQLFQLGFVPGVYMEVSSTKQSNLEETVQLIAEDLFADNQRNRDQLFHHCEKIDGDPVAPFVYAQKIDPDTNLPIYEANQRAWLDKLQFDYDWLLSSMLRFSSFDRENRKKRFYNIFIPAFALIATYGVIHSKRAGFSASNLWDECSTIWHTKNIRQMLYVSIDWPMSNPRKFRQNGLLEWDSALPGTVRPHQEWLRSSRSRRNPDERIRKLERQAIHGDLGDNIGALVAKLRAGHLPAAQIQAAACLLHPAALAIFPQAAGIATEDGNPRFTSKDMVVACGGAYSLGQSLAEYTGQLSFTTQARINIGIVMATFDEMEIAIGSNEPGIHFLPEAVDLASEILETVENPDPEAVEIVLNKARVRAAHIGSMYRHQHEIYDHPGSAILNTIDAGLRACFYFLEVIEDPDSPYSEMLNLAAFFRETCRLYPDLLDLERYGEIVLEA